MTGLRPYEIYRIKYADPERLAGKNFIGGNPKNGPMPVDYFVGIKSGSVQLLNGFLTTRLESDARKTGEAHTERYTTTASAVRARA